MKTITLPFLLVAFLFSTSSAFAIPTRESVEIVRCPVCGTEIKPTSKTIYIGEREGEKVKMCSFACASKYSKRHSISNLMVMDYMTGQFIPAETASYLVKSEKVAALLKSEMPPYVIAVKNKTDARDRLKEFDDGEYIEGYINAKHAFE